MTTATMNGTNLISQDQLQNVFDLEERIKALGRALFAKREGIEALLRAGVPVEEGEISAEIERKFSKLVSWKSEFENAMGEAEVRRLQSEAEPKLSERLIIRGA